MRYQSTKTFLVLGFIILGLMCIFSISAHARPVTSVVLYPSSSWDLQITAPGQACNVSALFGQSASLRLHASKGELKGISFRIEAANLEAQTQYEISLSSPDKQFGYVYTAKALSSKDIFILFGEDDPQAFLEQGQIMMIALNNKNYALSLKGLNEIIQMLLSCGVQSDKITQAPVLPQNVPSPIPANIVEDSKLPKTAGLQNVDDTIPAPPSENANLKIQPFPLDAEKNKTALLKVEEEHPSQLPKKPNAVAQIDPIAAPPQQERAVDDDKLFPKTEISQPEVMLEQSAANEVQVSPANNALSDTDSLIRPPVMDLPLPPVENTAPLNRKIEDVDLQAGISAPDGIIVNTDAQLYVTNESQSRIMEKNDIDDESKAFARPIARDKAGLLSQTHAMASVEPIIIPSVPEVALPTRFDLMNRGAPVQGASKIQSEPPRKVREVSNEALEQQMKNMLLGENSSVEIKPYPQPNNNEKSTNIDLGASETIQVAAAPPPVIEKSTPTKAAMVAEKQKSATARWNAAEGADFQTIVAQWSVDEGVEMIWDTQDQYKVIQPLSINGSYEQALASLLSQYSDVSSGTSRPKGELYVDPENKKRILIIQSGF